MIRATWHCNDCGAPARARDLATTRQAVCSCGRAKDLPGDAIIGGQVHRCPFCGTNDLYIQKDFPERIGVAVVVIGALLSTWFWWQRSWLGAIGTLVVFFLIDLVLFRRCGDVTVCYRCLAQFRGVAPNPRHQPFDLALGERYRQERLRKEAMRRREPGASATGAATASVAPTPSSRQT